MNYNQAVCVNCGVEKGKGSFFCANCGLQLPPQAKVCMRCGVKTQEYLNGQDKAIMALICFFLGGLGIHNFMMGETKKGVFKIIMNFACGIAWIFSLIDFIKILCGSYEVDPDKLV